MSTTPSTMTERLDLPDVNVLVALVHPGHTHHEHAVEWLQRTAGFATTPITESGLLRLGPAARSSALRPRAGLR